LEMKGIYADSRLSSGGEKGSPKGSPEANVMAVLEVVD
jgi:hypothetical protein